MHILSPLLGCPISREDVFRYTNGRFLADEMAQIAKRYVRFDLDKLCDLVVSVSGSQKSPVCKIDKMEGGFSKALLMMMENGSEVVVNRCFMMLLCSFNLRISNIFLALKKAYEQLFYI